MRSGITRRWLRGSLLITVLLVLLVVKKFSITEYVATATKIVAAMVESL